MGKWPSGRIIDSYLYLDVKAVLLSLGIDRYAGGCQPEGYFFDTEPNER